ncbi:DUF3991 and TOPRIM domain-containing protein [Periweissella cryptocerci]|nr:DUF3991 and TOPRIM domain-containing protein [Periweissella cryptocerci]
MKDDKLSIEVSSIRELKELTNSFKMRNKGSQIHYYDEHGLASSQPVGTKFILSINGEKMNVRTLTPSDSTKLNYQANESTKIANRNAEFEAFLDDKGIEHSLFSIGRWVLIDQVNHHGLRFDESVGYYSSMSHDGEFGGVKNFIRDYYKVSDEKAIKEYKEWLSDFKPESQVDVPFKKSNVFSLSKLDLVLGKKDVIDTYLVEERKISQKLVDDLYGANLISVDTKNNIDFLWYDHDGSQIVGADKQGTVKNYKKFPEHGNFKGIASGSAKGYGFKFRHNGGDEVLVITESPIDLISYYQVNDDMFNEKSSVTMLSTSGVLKLLNRTERSGKVEFNGVLPTFLRDSGKLPQKIIIGFDNDDEGLSAVDSFLQNAEVLLQNTDVEVHLPIEGKDWNEELQSGASGRVVYTANGFELARRGGAYVPTVVSFNDDKDISRKNSSIGRGKTR